MAIIHNQNKIRKKKKSSSCKEINVTTHILVPNFVILSPLTSNEPSRVTATYEAPVWNPIFLDLPFASKDLRNKCKKNVYISKKT